MNVAPNDHYQLHARARFRVLDDEGIFVLQEAGEVLTVNQVGAFVVERLRADSSVSEVVDDVVAHFEVDQDRAATDIAELIAELVEAGALRSA